MPKLVGENMGSQPHPAAAVAEAAQVALDFGQSSSWRNWTTAPPSRPPTTPRAGGSVLVYLVKLLNSKMIH